MIRAYTSPDYSQLKKLYEDYGWFDPETDSEERLKTQIGKYPDSILVIENEGNIIGSVTLLYTERLGIFFRLIADDNDNIRELIKKGEEIFFSAGYREVHVIAPSEDHARQDLYEKYGFKKGKNYSWFWKKI